MYKYNNSFIKDLFAWSFSVQLAYYIFYQNVTKSVTNDALPFRSIVIIPKWEVTLEWLQHVSSYFHSKLGF